MKCLSLDKNSQVVFIARRKVEINRNLVKNIVLAEKEMIC